jgi:hypothetical protein
MPSALERFVVVTTSIDRTRPVDSVVERYTLKFASTQKRIEVNASGNTGNGTREDQDFRDRH